MLLLGALLSVAAAAAPALVRVASAATISHTGSLTTADALSSARRLAANGTASSCGSAKAVPALATDLALRYDPYFFKNTSAVAQCVTVILDASGCPSAVSSAAYSPA